jgi:hypothetical protein
MTRTELQTGGDAAIVASLTELMVTYLSEAHCIMPDQARALVERLGPEHPDLDAEAERLSAGRAP